MADTKNKRTWVLDGLYNFVSSGFNHPISMSALFHDEIVEEQDQDDWLMTLIDLSMERLIDLSMSDSFNATSAQLTAAGRTEVEDLRKRRANPKSRKVAARDAVLRWVVAHPRQSVAPIEQAPDYYFEGQPLTQADVAESIEYLRQRRLIDGLSGDDTLVVAWPTAEGIDCDERPEGSVSDYLHRRGGGHAGPTVNIHGDNNGILGWANGTIKQEIATTTTTTTGAIGEELKLLIAALLQAKPALGLSKVDADALNSDLKVVEGQLSASEPNKDVAGNFMQRALGVLEKQAENALAMVLTAFVKAQMTNMGLPPQ